MDTWLQDTLGAPLSADTLPGRFKELYRHLVRKDHLQRVNLDLLKAWLDDLRRAQYTFPRLQPQHAEPPANFNLSTEAKIIVQDPRTRFVFMRHWCVHHDKVLYINFNYLGHINLTRLLHAVYRPLFRRVMFAGSMAGLPAHKQSLPSVLHQCDSFIRGSIDGAPGFFAHMCFAGFLASDEWKSVDGQGNVGVLYINDDVFFSPCMLTGLNSTRIWYNKALDQHGSLKAEQGWLWGNIYGRHTSSLKNATILALQRSYGLMGKRVQEQLQGGALHYGSGQADIFYLPARFHRPFISMAHQMHAQRVITEVAVPNMLGLLKAQRDDSEVVEMAFSWGDAERKCLVNGLFDILPQGGDLNCTSVQPCAPQGQAAFCVHAHCDASVYPQDATCKSASMFAVHPFKLSHTQVASHWLRWWASQGCS